MNVRMIWLAFSGSIFLLSGCADIPTPPMMPKVDPRTSIKNLDQFTQILNDVAARKGQAIQLAGHLHSVEETQHVYKVFASWLPYPWHGVGEDGPSDVPGVGVPDYLFYFDGKMDMDEFTFVTGDKFILTGTIQGTEKFVVDFLDEGKKLLVVSAKCVHIWDTGTSEGGSGTTMEYPGEIARTFCAQK